MIDPPEPRDLPPRTSENDKRLLCSAAPSAERIQELLARAEYEGYGKHKRNPHLWGLQPFHGHAPDRTFCEDAGFTIQHRPRVLPLLQRGISAGLFSEQERQGVPTKLWTIDDNGWIYEFAITNAGAPLYHGYPIRRSDAMARKVIDHFEKHVIELAISKTPGYLDLLAALRAAQISYS